MYMFISRKCAKCDFTTVDDLVNLYECTFKLMYAMRTLYYV